MNGNHRSSLYYQLDFYLLLPFDKMMPKFSLLFFLLIISLVSAEKYAILVQKSLYKPKKSHPLDDINQDFMSVLFDWDSP
ncbi:hypothetical protein CMK18_04970 [Candidatus Poribacteria bacterium]|nr:hypothetical protein [Candidatus Poribacteria bacterium]